MVVSFQLTAKIRVARVESEQMALRLPFISYCCELCPCHSRPQRSHSCRLGAGVVLLGSRLFSVLVPYPVRSVSFWVWLAVYELSPTFNKLQRCPSSVDGEHPVLLLFPPAFISESSIVLSSLILSTFRTLRLVRKSLNPTLILLPSLQVLRITTAPQLIANPLCGHSRKIGSTLFPSGDSCPPQNDEGRADPIT
jgi:hypothetical protein